MVSYIYSLIHEYTMSYSNLSKIISSFDLKKKYVYRAQAIILYKQILRDHQVRIVLFSEEYGKITAWAKSSDGGDIGSIAEILIERKN
jgi:UDP-N-acetylglucosamine transferase subunit ALG13